MQSQRDCRKGDGILMVSSLEYVTAVCAKSKEVQTSHCKDKDQENLK